MGGSTRWWRVRLRGQRMVFAFMFERRISSLEGLMASHVSLRIFAAEQCLLA